MNTLTYLMASHIMIMIPQYHKSAVPHSELFYNYLIKKFTIKANASYTTTYIVLHLSSSTNIMSAKYSAYALRTYTYLQ